MQQFTQWHKYQVHNATNETYKHSHVIYNNTDRKLYENNFCNYRICEI